MNNLRQSLEQALNELEIGRAFLAAEILKSVINQPEQEHCLWARNGNEPCPHVQKTKTMQEPVAWIEHGLVEAPDALCWERGSVGNYTPLYTAPTPPTVPKGYALVSIDALKAWNKYDEVLAACQYSIKE